MQGLDMQALGEYEHQLLEYTMSRMREIPGMRFFGEADMKSSVISFALADIHHSDVGVLLDKLGIAVRTGQMCAEPIMTHYGITGVVRASLGMYNTREEIDIFIEGLKRVASMFGIK